MANRERTVRLQVMVNEEEAELIKYRMERLGVTNFSMYARKMLVDGYIIKHDFGAIKSLAKELGNLARSINQIVRRANETRNIYEEDLRDLQRMYFEVKAKVSERLVKMMKE